MDKLILIELWAAIITIFELEIVILRSTDSLSTTKGIKSLSSSTNFIDNANTGQTMTHLVNDPTVQNEMFKSLSTTQQEQVPFFIRGAFPSTPSSKVQPFSFDVEAPVKTMLSFCPLTQSCHKGNVTNHHETGNECCLPCDCSERCYVTGTCCAEMTIGSSHHLQQPPEAPILDSEESCINTFITGTDIEALLSSYLLFQKCWDTEDFQTKTKCLHPDVFQLEEMIPVYSQKTNRHYRNVFCSKCYDDAHDLVLWQTSLRCNSTYIFYSGFPKLPYTFTISKFISTNPNCALLWDPPKNTKADRCFSEQNIVSDCNKPILSTLCKLYYAPVHGDGIIYRNVFCMECRHSSNLTGVYTKCYPVSAISHISFISLLSLNIDQKTSSKSNMSESSICSLPKIYNDKLGSCIYHTCAITDVKVADICKPVFSKIKGSHLEYRLKLFYRIIPEDILKSLHSVLYDSNIMAVIGLKINTDKLCFADFLDVKITSEQAVMRVAYIKPDMFLNIKQSYEEYENNIELYNKIAREKKEMFLMQIDKSDIEPIPDDVVTIAKFTRSNLTHFCVNSIAMTKLQFCETITFQRDEFRIYENGNVSVENIMFRPGEFVLRKTLNGTIKYMQVCLNDYIFTHKFINEKYQATSNGKHSRKFKSGILCLLCAVVALSNKAN